MPEPPTHPIHSPHDKFFKESFSHPEVALDVFQTVLPARLFQEADWTALALRPGSFVDEHLAETSSDLLYRVPFRGSPLSLYLLFEHKSTPEELRLDLLQYMVRVWKQDRKEAAPGSACPPIVAIVLYHGKRPWPYSTRFVDWLGMPNELRDELTPFQPDFRHVLLDLGPVPMEAIAGRLQTRLTLTLMKAVQEGRVLEWLERFGSLLLELAREEGRLGQFRVMLRYLFEAEASASSIFRDLAAKVEHARVKQGVMTIAEQLKQEGRQEGRREGALIGQIQTCQELLNLPVSGLEELAQQSVEEMESLLRELKARLRNRAGM